MKIAVVGSNGRVGSLVVKEALSRGLEVTVFANGENKSDAKNFVSKNALNLLKEELNTFD